MSKRKPSCRHKSPYSTQNKQTILRCCSILTRQWERPRHPSPLAANRSLLLCKAQSTPIRRRTEIGKSNMPVLFVLAAQTGLPHHATLSGYQSCPITWRNRSPAVPVVPPFRNARSQYLDVTLAAGFPTATHLGSAATQLPSFGERTVEHRTSYTHYVGTPSFHPSTPAVRSSRADLLESRIGPELFTQSEIFHTTPSDRNNERKQETRRRPRQLLLLRAYVQLPMIELRMTSTLGTARSQPTTHPRPCRASASRCDRPP